MKCFIVRDPRGATKDGAWVEINHRLIYDQGTWFGTHNLYRHFTSEGMYEKFLAELLRNDSGQWGMWTWERDRDDQPSSGSAILDS